MNLNRASVRRARFVVSALRNPLSGRGRQRAILSRREKIKRLTLERRKKENLRDAA
jgi:hypothetical protein